MLASKASATDTLRRVSLFADLTDTDIQFLAQHAVSRQYAGNELVFSEGELCAGISFLACVLLLLARNAPRQRIEIRIDGSLVG